MFSAMRYQLHQELKSKNRIYIKYRRKVITSKKKQFYFNLHLISFSSFSSSVFTLRISSPKWSGIFYIFTEIIYFDYTKALTHNNNAMISWRWSSFRLCSDRLQAKIGSRYSSITFGNRWMFLVISDKWLVKYKLIKFKEWLKIFLIYFGEILMCLSSICRDRELLIFTFLG